MQKTIKTWYKITKKRRNSKLCRLFVCFLFISCPDYVGHQLINRCRLERMLRLNHLIAFLLFVSVFCLTWSFFAFVDTSRKSRRVDGLPSFFHFFLLSFVRFLSQISKGGWLMSNSVSQLIEKCDCENHQQISYLVPKFHSRFFHIIFIK